MGIPKRGPDLAGAGGKDYLLSMYREILRRIRIWLAEGGSRRGAEGKHSESSEISSSLEGQGAS